MIRTIAPAITSLQHGQPIIVIDGPDRENEGDIVAAAEFATPDLINFIITEGRGLICCPLTEKHAKQLELPRMVDDARNKEPHKCNFTVSVDAAQGITTGISTPDRATTVKLLSDPHAGPAAFVRPGHIFPLIAKPGGCAGA